MSSHLRGGMADFDRQYVPDPALMRRACRRMILALIVFLVLSSPFTIGGISLVATGNLPGLPFAFGGAVLQIAALITVAATIAVRASLDDATVSGRAVSTSRRILTVTRLGILATIVALLLFAAIRVFLGDYWSLLTAVLISGALWLTASMLRRVRQSYDRVYNIVVGS